MSKTDTTGNGQPVEELTPEELLALQNAEEVEGEGTTYVPSQEHDPDSAVEETAGTDEDMFEDEVLIHKDEEKSLSSVEGIRANPDADKARELSEIYTRKSLESASRKEKDAMYHSSRNETRIVGDGEGLMTDEQQLREETLKLAHSMQSGQILKGTIVAVEDADYMPLAIVSMEGGGMYRIVIPAFHLIDFDESILRYPDQKNAVLNELQHRIGSHVSFMVFRIVENECNAYASRISAMDLLGKRNFIDLQRGEDLPLLFPGLKTNATVVAVHKHDLAVEVGGVECIIPRRELSWNPLGRLNHEFHIGDKFFVKIISVAQYSTKRGGSVFKNMIRLEVSRKQASINPNQKYYEKYKVGQVCDAEVKFCTTYSVQVVLAGQVACTCRIPQFAAGPSGELPTPGQKCLVRITTKNIRENEETKERAYLFGGAIIFYNN